MNNLTKDRFPFVIYYGIQGEGAIIMDSAQTRKEAEDRAEEHRKNVKERLGDMARIHTYFVVENDK
jgi:hypothetical protein